MVKNLNALLEQSSYFNAKQKQPGAVKKRHRQAK